LAALAAARVVGPLMPVGASVSCDRLGNMWPCPDYGRCIDGYSHERD